jgi:hypothetical protein
MFHSLESVPGTKAGAENMPDSPGEEAKPGELPGEQPDADQEIGGPQGPEPTRYGDWERKGRCIDF